MHDVNRNFLLSIFFMLMIFLVSLDSKVLAASDEDTAGGSAVGKFYETALQHFTGGDYRAAVIQLKNALQQDSKHLPSRILLGRSYLASEFPVQAEAEFLQARKLGADMRTVDPLLAETFLQLGKFQSVLDEIAIDPNSTVEASKLRVFKGKAYLGLNEPDRAMWEFVEASRYVAQRVMSVEATAEARIEQAFRLLTGKRPDDHQLSVLLELYDTEKERFAADPASATRYIAIGQFPPDASLEPIELGTMTLVANTIMNFDDFYMKR